MRWFCRRTDHEQSDPFRGAPEWARVIIMQNEAILARIEQRANKLSPQDQLKVDELFAIAVRDKKKIDAALKT